MQNNKEIDNIIDSLVNPCGREELDILLVLESLAGVLNRRQVLVLRLLLLNTKISQTTIAKMLGFSASTINLDLAKIKTEVIHLYQQEGQDISKLLKRIDVNKPTVEDVFISEVENNE